MQKTPFIALLVFALLFFHIKGYGQNNYLDINGKLPQFNPGPYSLSDFYANQVLLSKKVDSVYATLSDTQRVAQMIVSSIGKAGQPFDKVQRLVEKGYIGGVNVMGDTETSHSEQIAGLMASSLKHLQLPLLFCMDAEPSLMNNRMPYYAHPLKTNSLKDSAACMREALRISKALKQKGILLNFAPVADLSNQNTAITHRSFGSDIDSVIWLNKIFISTSEGMGVVATVKHFPGHGLVSGDTHHRKVYIDGELKELPVFSELIKMPAYALMVGHLTIINNPKYGTHNLPATCSPVIIQNLLQDELGYKGLIITDALGMNASAQIENIGLKASQAGCDILLMPTDEFNLLCQLVSALQSDPAYQLQVEKSVKKILRMKLCLGLMD